MPVHAARSLAELRPRVRRKLGALALFALAASLSQPAHAAGSFSLSSCPACDQRGAGAVAGNPQGAFATAWTGATSNADPAVLGRFFKPDGSPRSADVVLSAAAAFTGGDSAVAAEGSGFFAAAWSRKDGINSEVMVQRFRRTTAPLGGVIQVSVDEPGTVRVDFAPAIAFLADGSFLVAWERYGPQVGSSPVIPIEVMTRRFAWKTGKPFGPPQKISSSLVEGGHVALCANRAGAIGAAWTSKKEDVPFEPSAVGAVFRRLTPNGQPLGAEVPIAANAAGIGGVSLSCSASAFTVAWRSDQAPGDGPSILARRIGTGGALGATLALSSAAVLISPPASFDDAHGDTVVAWVAQQDRGTNVLFRKLDGAGTPGAERAVAAITSFGAPLAPAVSGIGKAGDFVLVWSGRDGLFGRRVAASGVPLAAGMTAADLDPLSADER